MEWLIRWVLRMGWTSKSSTQSRDETALRKVSKVKMRCQNFISRQSLKRSSDTVTIVGTWVGDTFSKSCGSE
jgi:hypothetical protein